MGPLRRRWRRHQWTTQREGVCGPRSRQCCNRLSVGTEQWGLQLHVHSSQALPLYFGRHPPSPSQLQCVLL